MLGGKIIDVSQQGKNKAHTYRFVGNVDVPLRLIWQRRGVPELSLRSTFVTENVSIKEDNRKILVGKNRDRLFAALASLVRAEVAPSLLAQGERLQADESSNERQRRKNNRERVNPSFPGAEGGG